MLHAKEFHLMHIGLQHIMKDTFKTNLYAVLFLLELKESIFVNYSNFVAEIISILVYYI